ncbi:MAG: hypothetical protein II238_02385 [Alphaproteobacteria bacterium]|nr:hypothetical protein [Alphaproteobacteria bacterium]
MATMLERNKKVKTPKKSYAEHAQDALYREVWEEVNNEKTIKFIKTYSKHIMVAVFVVLIVATGVQIGVRTHRANQIATAVAYETAINSVDANALAALAKDTSGAMGDLALFQAYMLDKDTEKIEMLASDGDTADFRDLAKLHVIGIRGNDMTAAQVEKYLSDLNTKKSPFYYTAALTVAQKYLAEGDVVHANKWLDKIINDADAPSVISGTAQSLR